LFAIRGKSYSGGALWAGTGKHGSGEHGVNFRIHSPAWGGKKVVRRKPSKGKPCCEARLWCAGCLGKGGEL